MLAGAADADGHLQTVETESQVGGLVGREGPSDS